MKTTHSPAEKSLKADPKPEELSALLEPLKAHERILQLKEIYRSRLVASSSFGLQASVMLHLISKHAPEIPIIFVDTGYCFPETYQFALFPLFPKVTIESLLTSSRNSWVKNSNI